jgi:hypothetical protein
VQKEALMLKTLQSRFRNKNIKTTSVKHGLVLVVKVTMLTKDQM